jgi:hypothetical protein
MYITYTRHKHELYNCVVVLNRKLYLTRLYAKHGGTTAKAEFTVLLRQIKPIISVDLLDTSLLMDIRHISTCK